MWALVITEWKLSPERVAAFLAATFTSLYYSTIENKWRNIFRNE